MLDAPLSQTDILSRMDDSEITKQHWKIMFISGMGFFTDAYDLFIIGVVMSILKDEWHPSPVAVGLVTSTALLASAVGAILFGRVADMLGRKRIYGYEVLVLAVGAIASAFSPDIWWLIGFRIILGIGIGGDYPVSATLMSEYAGKKSRGMMVSLVFAMQAAGLVFGPLLAAAFLASASRTTWCGACCWRSAPYRRWRCSSCAGRWRKARAICWRAGSMRTPTRHRTLVRRSSRRRRRRQSPKKVSFAEGFVALTRRRDMAVRLIGASAAWFLMDFAYYGNTVSSPLVLHAVAPNDSLIAGTLTRSWQSSRSPRFPDISSPPG